MELQINTASASTVQQGTDSIVAVADSAVSSSTVVITGGSVSGNKTERKTVGMVKRFASSIALCFVGCYEQGFIGVT
jgi:hypothetical protein